MKEVLRTKGNLSALGLDGITNQPIKLEREKGAKMLIEPMKMILNAGFCPTEWKNARTILLYKEGKEKTRGTEDQLQLRVLFAEPYFAELHKHYTKHTKMKE
jgi:hypothetical protein